MTYKRNLVDVLPGLMAQFPVLVILGARQVGKTTLAKELVPHFQYFDLEQRSHYLQISQDVELFFKQYPDQLILDEAEWCPEIFTTLRGVVDQKRNQKGRFILTGSSSPELKNRVSETLAGRVAIVELGTLKANEMAKQPLSKFYEALLAKEGLHLKDILSNTRPLSQAEVYRAWVQGGYPELLHDPDPEFRERWFQFYEESYLNRDVAKLFSHLNRHAYQRFLKMLSYLSGTILNKSELARDIEIAESSVRSYLEIVEGTFLWRNLPSFEGSRKSVVKMPRGHLRDSGLLHFLLNLHTEQQILAHPAVGHSFESFVIEEILKGFGSLVARIRPYYYRTRGGAEIDLVLEGSFGLLPIEIKYGTHTPLKKLTALSQFIEEQDLAFGLLINQGERLTWLTPKILQVPVGYI